MNITDKESIQALRELVKKSDTVRCACKPGPLVCPASKQQKRCTHLHRTQ